MPSEPAESNFKNKVHATAYPTHERNGIIWAYMGPREVPPPLPDIEANMLCEGPHQISMLLPPLQLDAGPRGRDGHRPRRLPALRRREVGGRRARAPSTTTTTASATPSSSRWRPTTALANGAYRPAEEDSYYWRVTQILFPFYHMIPGGTLGEGIRIGAYVPMDDDHHMQWEIGVFKPGRRSPSGRARQPRGTPAWTRRSARTALPNTTGWYGRFHIDQNLANDYLIDREAQATLARATPASPASACRTCAVTETMGTIYDRSHEHLGTTDAFIIRTRRKLIAMAKALRENGVAPLGVDTRRSTASAPARWSSRAPGLVGGLHFEA